jgi:hypothetical protein
VSSGTLSATAHKVTVSGYMYMLLWTLLLVLKFAHTFHFSPWPESASELFRPSDRRLSAKLVPTFADIGCHAISVTDPYGRILGSHPVCS